ncbi:MAG: glycosyltransferase [Gemmatimonadaceae bacterium]
MKLEVLDRLIELPYRFLPSAHARAAPWDVSRAELSRVGITWPMTYQWPPAAAFTDTIKRAFSRLDLLEVAALKQTHRGVVRILVTLDDKVYAVMVDYADNADGINEDALAQCSLYFKFQYRVRGYSDPRIIPGGYSVSSEHYYRYHGPLRRRYEGRASIGVLGRFGYKFHGELRAKAVDILSGARDVHFVGAGKRVRYSRFLRDVASARLSLDLPGNGPFTFRVPEFLGLGTCLISPRYATSLHVPLIPGVHYVAIEDDLGDLLEKCRYYLAHEEERARIARAGRDYFDRYLHRDHLATYYLRAMLDRLGSRGESSELGDRARLYDDRRIAIPKADARDGVAQRSIGREG